MNKWGFYKVLVFFVVTFVFAPLALAQVKNNESYQFYSLDFRGAQDIERWKTFNRNTNFE